MSEPRTTTVAPALTIISQLRISWCGTEPTVGTTMRAMDVPGSSALVSTERNRPCSVVRAVGG
jgi:hypothetical protein